MMGDKNSDVEVQDGVDSQPPQQQDEFAGFPAIFCNPLITDVICSHLPISTLKSIRYVSSSWERFSTSHLGSKTYIQLEKHIPLSSYPTMEFPLPPRLNRKILQKLRLDFTPAHLHKEEELIEMEVKISTSFKNNPQPIHFLSQLNDTVVELRLTSMHIGWMHTYFVTTFSTLAFRVLKIIQLLGIYIWTSGEKEICSKSLNFPLIPKLQELYLHFYPCPVPSGSGSASERQIETMTPIFQAMINASPNLATLEIVGFNCYPDLSRSKKLKEIFYSGTHLKNDPHRVIDFPWREPFTASPTFVSRELRRMIGQVADSLESLELTRRFDKVYDHFHPQINEFRLPILPKLKSLELDINTYKPTWIVSKKCLPNLTRLELGSRGTYDRKLYPPLINSIPLPHDGVDELTLNFDLRKSFNSNICLLFPSVTKLKLTLGKDQGPIDAAIVRESLQSLLGWNNLTHSCISLQYVGCDLFLLVLQTMGLLKGNKDLKCVPDSDGGWVEFSKFSEKINLALRFFSDRDTITVNPEKIPVEAVSEMSKIAIGRNVQILFKKRKWTYG